MNEGVLKPVHPVQILLVISSGTLILWGLVCVVAGANYVGQATVEYQSRSESGKTQDGTFHADVFFIVYGCLAFFPPLAFFYARWRARHAFAPTMSFFYLGFLVYTMVGSVGAGLYSQELVKLPGALKTVAIIHYGVIAIPVIIVLLFILSVCKCPNAKCSLSRKKKPKSAWVPHSIKSSRWKNDMEFSGTGQRASDDIAVSADNEYPEAYEFPGVEYVKSAYTTATMENQNFTNDPYMSSGNFESTPVPNDMMENDSSEAAEAKTNNSEPEMPPSYFL